ncbi:MAG TPA: UvrD-helicase domain-containing protein [Gemmatimonadaceae bacterium]|nr:UvrD-helicase domain-containing protein [Gemmatimonadaceae bacterium]
MPSPSQREAIEAGRGPLLVVAGPGAGKTYCLIERIRYLIETLAIAPERLCAFTFTNKAAGEIADRLGRSLGIRAAAVKTGTIHAFCAELLREFGHAIGLERGFGIVDERQQRAVLRRLAVPPRWHSRLLSRFATHRFCGASFEYSRDGDIFDRYQRFLDERHLVDFDQLVLKTADLLGESQVVMRIAARWDCILVDEFQDLNPVQYAVIRDIGRDHRHIFAVGDDEQSIYSWAGADPRVFVHFMNDFSIARHVQLRENRRCPRPIVSRARKLIEINAPLLARKELAVDRDSPFDVLVRSFPNEATEIAWVIEDLRRDRKRHGLSWGDFALLYRKHEIGDLAEAGLLTAGLPCRLAQGRAVGEDPVCEYVVAALGVIAHGDDLHDDTFLEVVLPGPLVDDARAKAGTARSLVAQLQLSSSSLPREHGDAKKIKRALYTLRNLAALGRRHVSLSALVEEILSQRVGVYRTTLEEHHDELSDPAANLEVVQLAAQLEEAVRTRQPILLPHVGGAEIGLKGMLAEVGVPSCHPEERIDLLEAPAISSPVALFKAAQLLRMGSFRNEFRDFTAIDLETTDTDVATAEIIELAAVRVRAGVICDQISSLIRPRCAITPGAARAHGLTDADVATAPNLEEVWPRFAEFCGTDVLVAHNGYQFDFPLLRRLTGAEPCTYDTLPLARELHSGSAKLTDLAVRFGVEAGVSHRALDDARTLARVFLALGESKIVRARKTSLVHVLDYLGVALALWDGELDNEGQLLRRLCRPFSLGRYSDCLEYYRAERDVAGDSTLPTVRQLIERLGGAETMQRIRAERSASERYPIAMARLRRLMSTCTPESLGDQIAEFLERVALSSKDGIVPARERVNLLTMHSTKGLEFSRVYILGVEDAQLPGGTPLHPATANELEEARRLLYVGMTRARDRLVLTRAERRGGQRTGGHRFLDEMGLATQ